ncbi:class II aldolase/adducin family protein [Sphingorhabdus sp.]|jgi:ribulose-5-phosphate 4-epimerase/fuculose-1-phosphate aldolase|uniref:class II aldolase/adducin family protein n=1 Tax=Sphingorhabdus sp. TaxID=1902408 RepID=UPI0037CA8A1E
MSKVQSQISEPERQARVDLAALYRLVALEGWDDLIFTHISMRVPGPEHHFLINPFGMTFGEITASSLVKVDLEGNLVCSADAIVNPAGFVIHGAIHMARPDAQCVIHLHTVDGAALSVRREGLLPLTQHAMIIGGELAYHDYEGVALDLDERERLVADLGTKHIMLLRNHGTLAVGPNCGAAWLLIYYLERACSMQLRAMCNGVELVQPNQGVSEKVHGQSAAWFDGTAGAFAWPSFLSKLDRIDPGYRQ